MKILILSLVLSVIVFQAGAQGIKLQQNFESTDSIPPAGWGVYNHALFPIDPGTNWTVRDSGLALPGLSTALSVAHSGRRSIGVSWWAGIDTVSGNGAQSDAWLITPRIRNVQVGDSLKFWATGGTMNFLDSLQLFINATDSLPSENAFHLGSIIWPVGSTYGQYTQYTYDLSIAQGFDIWIGFRYFQDIAIDGFFVQLDDVSIEGPTSVTQLDNGIPQDFELSQNYPNPFNPTTTIRFGVPSSGFVSLKVYDVLGKEVADLVSEELTPGSFETRFDASGLSSGVYFYRLQAGEFAQTKKLILMR